MATTVDLQVEERRERVLNEHFADCPSMNDMVGDLSKAVTETHPEDSEDNEAEGEPTTITTNERETFTKMRVANKVCPLFVGVIKSNPALEGKKMLKNIVRVRNQKSRNVLT